MMVGITSRNTDMQRISECDMSVDRALGNDEICAQTSFDWSFHEDLFGEQYVQQTLRPRDVMDQQGDAQEDQQAEDFPPGLELYSSDGASDKDGDEYAAVESECDIVDETVRRSPMKMRTRSKARGTFVVPAPLMCSDTEDDEARPQQRKRNHTIATPLRAGATSKYLRRNSNQIPKHCQQDTCSL